VGCRGGARGARGELAEDDGETGPEVGNEMKEGKESSGDLR
jgi:hypothetical protein